MVWRSQNIKTGCSTYSGGTTCSGYSDQYSCDYSKTVNCEWCAGFPSAYCAPAGSCGTTVTSCSGIAQANCVGDCAWCSSKNNCVVGKDYASQCEDL